MCGWRKPYRTDSTADDENASSALRDPVLLCCYVVDFGFVTKSLCPVQYIFNDAHRENANDVLHHKDLRTKLLDETEEVHIQLVSGVIRVPLAISGKALARRPANYSIDFSGSKPKTFADFGWDKGSHVVL